MADLFALTEHLTAQPFDQAFKETFLGQAHIAGTGPSGTTCRECRYFHMMKDGEAVSPGHYSENNAAFANCLKPAKCHYPIPHKANRRFPHYARSCKLFAPSDNPWPAVKASAADGDD